MTEISGINDGLASHARPADAGRSDGFVTSLTDGVVGLVSATTVSATEVRADPSRSGDLRKGFAGAFTTLAAMKHVENL